MKQIIVSAITVILGFLFCTKNIFASSNIVINEFLANPPTGQKEWIELYNPAENNINLSGWTLSDKVNNTKNLTGLGIISAGSFAVYEYPGGDGWLNNTASSSNPESITLKNNDGSIIDSYTYTENQNENNSSGRTPDGTDNWTTFMSVTRGSPNVTTSTPTPTPSPILTLNPSSTPQTTSSFTISNIPSQINSDQSFSVNINLSMPNSQNTDYYFKGAFKKSDGTRYLGLTKIGSDWIGYSDDYSDQYEITTDSSGNWNGSIEVKPDTSDFDYKGTGDYIFKVSRYTANGSQTWSDESTIKIISTESDQDTILTDTTSSATSPSASSSSIKTTTTSNSNKSSKSKSYDTLVYHIASIAGATASATTSASSTSSTPSVVKNQKQTNPIIWVGLIFIFAGVLALGYIYLKKNAKIHIPFDR